MLVQRPVRQPKKTRLRNAASTIDVYNISIDSTGTFTLEFLVTRHMSFARAGYFVFPSNCASEEIVVLHLTNPGKVTVRTSSRDFSLKTR